MKRRILCLVLAAILAVPAVATAEVNGVYIAPKFLLGIQDSGQLTRSGTYDISGTQMASQFSQAVFGGALAVGFNFAPKFNVPLRTEIEFAMRSNSSNSKDVNISDPAAGSYYAEGKQTIGLHTLFFNAYFDIDTGTPLTPYIGGGLGMAFRHTRIQGEAYAADNAGNSIQVYDFSKSKHDTTFAWNLSAGLSYAFTENVSADLGYRFIHTGYSQVSADVDLHPLTGLTGGRAKVGSSPYIHEFYLGARFTF
jgi:opacity protein-like surface antigen